MAFQRPTLAELIARIQSDLTTRLGLTGTVLRRSVVAVLARVLAAAVYLLHGHLEFLGRQVFPDTSEAEYLERQAGLFGLARLAATYAAGNVTLTGTNGTLVPAGTLLQRADGWRFATAGDVTISGGTATAAVVAMTSGVDGNSDVAVSLVFVSPIAGVTATAAVAAGGLVGGADTESDDGLRARLLARMSSPPSGGSESDYIAWAKEIAGVSRAWVYPLESGPGTVTVRFVRDGDGAGAAIIPDAGEVAAVQAHIDAVRPVTAAVTVAAPVSVARVFSIHVAPDNADTRAAVTNELTDLLLRVAEPGATLLLSQIRSAIGAAAGVTDYSMTVPAADVTYTTGQIATMGLITWT